MTDVQTGSSPPIRLPARPQVLGPVKSTAIVICGIVFLHEVVTWLQVASFQSQLTYPPLSTKKGWLSLG